MYNFIHVKREELRDLFIAYYDSLIAPMDDMWELGILPRSEFYQITRGQTLGFFALNSDNVLTQFFILDNKDHEAFKGVIDHYHIKQAVVASYDPVFYNLCNFYKVASHPQTLLYKEGDHETIENKWSLTCQKALISDYDDLIHYYNRNDLGGPWLKDYVIKLINHDGLLIFKDDQTIVGTGEYRFSSSSPGVTNVGMTVDLAYRSKGIGAHILHQVMASCHELGYETICSTHVDNIASQKTIEKCGYQVYHKIYDVWF